MAADQSPAVQGAHGSGWWSEFHDLVSPTYLGYVAYEAGAASLRQFHGTVVPGLLQTRAYAAAVTARGAGPSAPAVRLRMRRQEELARRERPPREHYVIDEAVIRRHVGIGTDPSIMPAQLRHLAGVAEGGGRVSVRVVPFTAGAHAGIFGPFTLLGLDGDGTDVLYLEWRRTPSALITGDDPRVAACAEAFASLLEEALPPEESLALIRSVADEMS